MVQRLVVGSLGCMNRMWSVAQSCLFIDACLSALTIRAKIQDGHDSTHARTSLALLVSPCEHDVPSSTMELHSNELAEVDILVRNLDQIKS